MVDKLLNEGANPYLGIESWNNSEVLIHVESEASFWGNDDYYYIKSNPLKIKINDNSLYLMLRSMVGLASCERVCRCIKSFEKNKLP
jgi:hypothetical protein